MNDSIDEFFEREREAVPLLPAPAGRYEELQTSARRRRNRNTTAVSFAAAVVLAVVGTGAVIGAQNLGHRGTVTASSPTTSPSERTTTTTPAAVNPAVPTGFKAWSVSFVSNGAHGWALGGYPCAGGNECVAVLETTDSMDSWHTVALPAYAAEYGMTASNAILRFSTPDNGWMVGSEGVYATHDGGRMWSPIAALQSQSIDALEAWGNHTYAVGRDGSSLWTSTDPSSDTWVAQPGLDLPTATAGDKDSLVTENGDVAAVRTNGRSTTVRLSQDYGTTWVDVALPCTAGKLAPYFTLLDPKIGRVSCGDGSVHAIWFDGSNPDKLDGKLKLTSTTGTPVVAHAASTNNIGTVFAYSGAGLWNIEADGSVVNSLRGDVGYVGLSSDQQGIALPAVASDKYWVTRSGGLTWIAESFG